MSDIIQLLPNHVANQIAAGEVVQRPASVIKELMENAIDAGATKVVVIVKDAGKTLIQVIDNGWGMSDRDARMSFERHATSKIRKAEDLFHIVTKGFRGEALASIAAVSQVEMKTRTGHSSVGTHLVIEGSKVISQEPAQCAEGTNFMVKNLFFNVPARRYFLKSDPIELRHIIDEFQRVALTHPGAEFQLTHNGTELFSLPKATLRQRIVHVLGNRYNEKLVPVEEATDIVSVKGYIGKPDTTKKTRGDQFFFVNDRFIRNSYLNHAITGAFDKLLPQGHFPLYLLYLTIDPAQIDINIHPTKTEIKFQDERAIYAILHASVKRALGIHNIAPTIDFEQEASMNVAPARTDAEVRAPQININPGYNPFPPSRTNSDALKGWFDRREQQSSGGWKDLMAIQKDLDAGARTGDFPDTDETHAIPDIGENPSFIQIARRYLVTSSDKGLLCIDQQRAHQRILFEQYFSQVGRGEGASQQLLFPEQFEVSVAEAELLSDRQHEVASLGFDVVLGDDNVVNILGIPAELPVSGASGLMQQFIAQVLEDRQSLADDVQSAMAWALARSSAIRYGQLLTTPEMKELVTRLFACDQPFYAMGNKSTMVIVEPSFLERQFR